MSDSFSELQNKPGALRGSGFSGTGAMHNDPDSPEKAEPARTAISKAIVLVRILVSPKEIIDRKQRVH
jgi:hypothetical protein